MEERRNWITKPSAVCWTPTCMLTADFSNQTSTEIFPVQEDKSSLMRILHQISSDEELPKVVNNSGVFKELQEYLARTSGQEVIMAMEGRSTVDNQSPLQNFICAQCVRTSFGNTGKISVTEDDPDLISALITVIVLCVGLVVTRPKVATYLFDKCYEVMHFTKNWVFCRVSEGILAYTQRLIKQKKYLN